MTAVGTECDQLACLLRRCARDGDLEQGRLLHARILASHRHAHSSYLKNLLVRMYGQCGSVDEAAAAFHSIHRPNARSWTVMVTAYAQNGHLCTAREMFDRMPAKDAVAWNVMLNLYAQQGLMKEAQEVFDAMPQRDVVSWTAMVSGYARSGRLKAATDIFERMPRKSIVSWNTMLSAYASGGDLERCKQVFDAMPERDTVSWNSMVSAYTQNGDIEKAKELFDAMPPTKRDVASWNVLLSAYGDRGMSKFAFALLAAMDLDGSVRPDKVTLVAALQATDCLELGALVRDEILVQGMESDVKLCTALVSMYGRCGSSKLARNVFDAMPRKNTVVWTAMIAAYTRCERFKDAVRLFSCMDLEGTPADSVAMVAALEAYAKLGERESCEIIHSVIRGMNFGGVALCNGLLSMYTKCGRMAAARGVFDGMVKRDIITWNAAIAGYARNGQANEALDLFRTLELESIYQPNEASFSAVLLACSHGGLVEHSCYYFASMKREYGVNPTAEHYISMVDLLSRLGLLEQAQELLISSVEHQRDGWIALFSACKVHAEIKIGTKAGSQVYELDEKDGANLVLLESTLKMDAKPLVKMPP